MQLERTRNFTKRLGPGRSATHLDVQLMWVQKIANHDVLKVYESASVLRNMCPEQTWTTRTNHRDTGAWMKKIRKCRTVTSCERMTGEARCEGCLVVRSGHGPQAEVAQGVGPEPLVEL